MEPTLVTALAQEWLTALAELIDTDGVDGVDRIFTPDATWRDIVSLTWDIRSVDGQPALASMIERCRAVVSPESIALSPIWPPRAASRIDRDVIEVLFEFKTEIGYGEGVARLVPEAGQVRAWTVMTALKGLKDHPERFGDDRPNETDFTAHFGTPNWFDQRTHERTFADREPTVLVVGAGQAGLTVSARLRALGVDVLCIESGQRVGDNWRNRYHSLHLHNEIDFSHLPYMPFPETWPTYLPKDKMADWLEYYADAMDIKVWTGTRFSGARWRDAERCWTATVDTADGSSRHLRPKHIVVATGVSGQPRRAEIPGLTEFEGAVLHSSEFTSSDAFRGKKAIVFGVSNSGSDIAQDLHACGCEVTMVQRGSITVVSHNPGSLLLFGLYRQGWPLEVCDLINIANPGPASLESHKSMTRKVRELDRDLIAGLNGAGFRTDYGADDSGYGMKYFRSGGGHYLNVGCSELIIDGQVKLLPFDQVARIVPQGIELRSGQTEDASLIVLATGYEMLASEVSRLFGSEVAEKIGPVWGLDDEGELHNMWRPTAQPGLWFHAGSLYQCRVFSKYLALQIAAQEMGLPIG